MDSMLVIQTAKPRNGRCLERPDGTNIAFKLKPEADRHRTIEKYGGLGTLTNAPELNGQESPGKAAY